MRVKIVANIISDYQTFDEYKLPKNKSLNKKRKRISNLKIIHCHDTMIGQQYDFKQHHVCFDPNINVNCHLRQNDSIYMPILNLEVINELNGIECKDSNGVLQFLLLPRSASINGCDKKKQWKH